MRISDTELNLLLVCVLLYSLLSTPVEQNIFLVVTAGTSRQNRLQLSILTLTQPLCTSFAWQQWKIRRPGWQEADLLRCCNETDLQLTVHHVAVGSVLKLEAPFHTWGLFSCWFDTGARAEGRCQSEWELPALEQKHSSPIFIDCAAAIIWINEPYCAAGVACVLYAHIWYVPNFPHTVFKYFSFIRWWRLSLSLQDSSEI